jgi:hypothetical protein
MACHRKKPASASRQWSLCDGGCRRNPRRGFPTTERIRSAAATHLAGLMQDTFFANAQECHGSTSQRVCRLGSQSISPVIQIETMKTLLSITALFLVAAPFAGSAADANLPHLRAEIICHNGKLDTGSSCTSNAPKPGNPPGKNGKMTCGFPGKVSEITWSFVERRDGKDVYDFTRRFPIKSEHTATQTKQVHFAGKRVIVFEDKDQVIVIQSPK